MKNYQQLKTLFARISQLQYAQRILMWDEAVMMPNGAQKARADTIATLNRSIQRMLLSKKVKVLIDQAKNGDGLSEWDTANLTLMGKKQAKAACIPLTLTEQSTKAAIICEQVWRKMRAQNNWREFLPYFERSFQFTREIAQRESQALGVQPYDAMLDNYAAGFNQKNIDPVFARLKQVLPHLVQRVKEKQQEDTIVPAAGPFSTEKQKSLGLTVMGALQFDFNRGRLDVSHHPFCSGGPSDVRITTRYNENEFITSLFGICHETGHALYEQGLPEAWLDQPVGHVDNMVMHESQSLLIEMDVSRSLPFIEFLTPLLQNQFGTQRAFTPANLHKQVIRVQPGYIRVDADELTYPLHIILRYEFERALFNDEIALKDLPAAWNDMMTRYLGLSTLDNDRNGVMQDVHWPSGAFGYFPAYTLGRLMAAQLFATFNQAHPQFSEAAKHGQFQELVHWLRVNIHSQASSLPVNDLLLKVTGKPLDAGFFLDHIHKRYLK